MKKLILGAAAAATIVAAAAPASAQTFRHDGRGRVEQVQRNGFANRGFDRNVQFRQVQTGRWQMGQRFDRNYAANYRIIDNPGSYRLREAPRGYRWVQSGNDAVLVALASGLIGALVANAF
ncbi:MAG TPA: RcnB family protein [Allosphingosinicella sp.]|jgi:Ni/Co efflux regulator RcnB